MSTRRALLTNLGLLALLGGGAWWARDKVPNLLGASAVIGPDATAWLPFARPKARLATLKVRVNGVETIALLDSGAQYSVIDAAFASRIGLDQSGSLPVIAMGVGGGAQMARSAAINLEIGEMRFSSFRTAVLDLGPLGQEGGLAAALVLGFDLFSALVVDVDFPANRVRLVRREAFIAPSDAVPAPVRRGNRSLLASAKLDGQPIELLLDTGATGHIALSNEAAEAAGVLRPGRTVREGRSIVLGGVARSRVAKAESLSFAGETWRNVDVHVIALPRAPGFPGGLLGVESLRRFRAIIDAGGEQPLLLAPPVRRS